MDRINTSLKAVDLFGAGKHGFADALDSDRLVTSLNAEWFNGVQEEIVRAFEEGGFPELPDAARSDQLLRKLRTTRIAKALFSRGATVAVPATTRGLTCAPVPVVDAGFVAPAAGNGIAAHCGFGEFHYSVDQGRTFIAKPPGGSENYNDVAIYCPTSGFLIAAVGENGAWLRYNVPNDTITSGVIAGNPDLTHLIYTGNFWLACGNGGIWRAPDAATLTWTQQDDGGGLGHRSPIQIPAGFPNAGRVIIARLPSSELHYTDDDGATLIAGAGSVDVHPQVKGIFDPESGFAIFSSDETAPASKLIGTADGVSVADMSPVFSAGIAIPALLGGRAVVIFIDPTGNFTWIGMARGALPQTVAADWIVQRHGVNLSATTTFIPAVGSGDYILFLSGASGELQTTQSMLGSAG